MKKGRVLYSGVCGRCGQTLSAEVIQTGGPPAISPPTLGFACSCGQESGPVVGVELHYMARPVVKKGKGKK